MYMETNKFVRIGFQFFAEPNEGSNGGDPNNQGENHDDQNQQNQGKTFTQEELNAVAATEKKTARQAIFKALGVDVKDGDFEAATKAVKEVLDAGKTQQQKDKEAKESAESSAKESAKKVLTLQAQVDVMKGGVKPEYVDDVITMLLPKATEEKPLSKLLEEYKSKYPIWFEDEESSNGTGGATNPAHKKLGNKEGLGKRLAQESKFQSKSSYFKN